MLKNAGTLRAFYDSLSATDKAALKNPLKSYVSARMVRSVKKGSKGNKQARGAIGNLVEIICYGREPNNKSQADFPQCGIELKVTGLREHDDEAKERVSLSMIDNDMALGQGYYNKDLDTESAYTEFGPIKSANSILFITYKYQSGQYYMDARIKAAFIWTPSPKEKKAMRDDFIIIRRMCDHGFAHCLSEGLGEFMGAATKGAGKKKGDKPAAAKRNRVELMSSVQTELSNSDRFDIFKSKVKSKLKRVGAIKRRCYSLKRKSITAIISRNLNCP
jgi:DNA mismatch repair protein MutH